MKKIPPTLLVILLFGVVSPVFSDWTDVHQGGDVHLSLDDGTIERSDVSRPRAWLLFDYVLDQRIYKKSYRSSKEYVEFDCEKSRYQVLKFILYPEARGQGGAIDISSGKGAWHEMRDADPRTQVKERLCP